MAVRDPGSPGDPQTRGGPDDSGLDHHTGQVVLLLGFQLLSFAAAVAVWLAGPRDR